MYLAKIKVWNFRKYGIKGNNFEEAEPGIIIHLNPGLNVIIGENDSGKTAIIDAIRYVLGTQSREWHRIEENDFHNNGTIRAEKLKVECIFRGFTNKEAAPFLEWLHFEGKKGKEKYNLSVWLTARRTQTRIISTLRAGIHSEGVAIDPEARELLRVTYLKPLRDAAHELTPGRRSRLAQILSVHSLFQKDENKTKHKLEEIFEQANIEVNNYFSIPEDAGNANKLMKTLNTYLTEFFPINQDNKANMAISGIGLADILRRLELILGDEPVGLGSLNLLYIAAELLLLQSEEMSGLRLTLIEELEAHLHPQAQLRLIHFLQNEFQNTGQLILTSHSTTLGASIDLKN